MITPTIAIVGAGAAGTLVAANLLERTAQPMRVVLVDAAGTFGPGVAYSTGDELHLLNVPAASLSARSDRPDDFLDWARVGNADTAAHDFLPRRDYGQYLLDVLARAEQVGTARGHQLRRISGEVIAVRATDGGEAIELLDDTRVEADHVVLALGSLPPARLPQLPPGLDGVFDSPWQPGALAPTEGGTVLLVGAGLTAVDAALSLCARDDLARVVAVSRSGRMPRAHLRSALRPPVPPPAGLEGDPLALDDLVAAVTASAERAQLDGYDWRDVVDGLRPLVPELWARLGVDGQVRFLREQARSWEVRRHRMAPEVATRLRELREAGRFELRASRIAGATAADGGAAGLDVTLHVVGPGGDSTLRVERIIGCTGPAPDVTQADQPLVRQLLASGRAAADAHRLGLRTTAHADLLDGSGIAQQRLHLIGPLRRGELWETTAIPEIRAQAEGLAARLAASSAAVAR